MRDMWVGEIWCGDESGEDVGDDSFSLKILV
jgi:hypothetical protein